MSTPTTAPALFGGGLLGYVMYDVTHYYLHHGQPSHKVTRDLKVRNASMDIFQCHRIINFAALKFWETLFGLGK